MAKSKHLTIRTGVRDKISYPYVRNWIYTLIQDEFQKSLMSKYFVMGINAYITNTNPSFPDIELLEAPDTFSYQFRVTISSKNKISYNYYIEYIEENKFKASVVKKMLNTVLDELYNQKYTTKSTSTKDKTIIQSQVPEVKFEFDIPKNEPKKVTNKHLKPKLSEDERRKMTLNLIESLEN
ncbi:MAG: hypothetical protein ACOCP8_00100 [archaeon]